ncbi:putative uncharacterized protein DDB_G0271606 isoform X2 [Drosophila innubila]|uniref:putative uncharacterized protein DDB_G0271606 isoform X2 n=1 Tax=Drosophila innubila TaxID=198719 RepID=UPI00148D6482|nr:putative uncharacterized protein DDB_G0271606 isoform X2 [Drosophila innubila]
MSDAQDALRLYVNSSKERLLQLLQRLQWTEQGVLQQHRPKQAKDKNEEEFEKLPPSCMNATEQSVQLDAVLLQQLLGEGVKEAPQTFDELQLNYSASQKLILYEHVIKCTPRQRVSIEENSNFAELVAVTKRAQKKQRRHRKSKPTLHEEMHQLVELQMQALQQQQQQKQQQQQQQQQRQQTRRSRSHERWKASSSREQQRERSPVHWKASSSREKHRERTQEHWKRASFQEQRSEQRRQRSRSRSRKRRQRSRSQERHKKRSRSRSRSRSHSQRHKRSHYN